MLGLVIKREFTTLLGSKAMKISTIVLVLPCIQLLPPNSIALKY